ncbi:MAG: triose-phosphate isomerase [Ponticaulis sp.]|nr:triose-phosphate isomerase [Ponticaulis sp.]
MLKPLIAGNWKMNGLTASLQEVEALIEGLQGKDVTADVLICPAATLLDRLTAKTGDSIIETGGQDCHANEKGAHTGDISAEMIADIGGAYVIVGHSERRTDHGETDAMVREKAEAAIRAGLTPIICIGETLEQRKAGQALDVLGQQMGGSIPGGLDGSQFVIAYEPVWAIGTGLTPEAADIKEAHSFMRARLGQSAVKSPDKVRLLYGGSVKPSNATEILSIEDVNGALVGGASLKAQDFLGIIFH